MAEPVSRSRCDDCVVDIKLRDGHADGAGYVRPTDNLVGVLRISSVQRLSFSRVEVHLEGVEATTISSDWATPRTASRKLLTSAFYPSIPRSLSMETESSKNVYSLPFFFVMPDGSEFSAPSEPTLPPPFDASNAVFSFWSPIPFPDISISYFLQVVVTYTRPVGQPTTVLVTKPIMFLPYFEVPPPINLDSFPGEFILTIQRPLWKNIFHGRLGLATISTKEPSPLVYLSDVAQGSTECELDIFIECDHFALRRLRNATVKINPIICAKTYFSSKRLPGSPAKSLVTGNGPIHIHQDWLRLDNQNFQNLNWTFSPRTSLSNELPGQERWDAPSPPDYNESVLFSPSSVQRRFSSDSIAAAWQAGIWQTSIRVPITPARRLHPSFRSHRIARSYSLLVHVSFGGVYAGKFELEAPLQVAYPRQPVRSSQCAVSGNSFRDYTSESLPTYDELMS